MNYFKKRGFRVWFIVTTILVALLLVINILLSTSFNALICTVLGGKRVIMKNEGASATAYSTEFTTKEQTRQNGNKKTIAACEEGFVMLKNNNNALPLTAGAKISVFGKNSVNMALGGSGSGGILETDITKAEKIDIFKALTDSGFTYNPTLKSFYEDNNKSGNGRDANNSDLDNGEGVSLSESFVGETPAENYTDDIWNSCKDYKDVALMVVTRVGGEGADLPRTAEDHILKLRPAELDLLENIKKQGFGKVVILLNAATSMELTAQQKDDGVDGILWIGYAGNTGLTALGEILKGDINPSGRTVDLFSADFMKDPTWQNTGSALGETASSKISADAYWQQAGKGKTSIGSYFTDDEENIYYGYRYYETAAAENYINYDDAVVYPFGYGLSYTNFSWKLKNADSIKGMTLNSDTKMTFEVEVTNDGAKAGRDVVEIYVTAPYTKGGIEKSAKELVGFAKTGIIDPGKSETVSITVDSPYEYASYDCYDKNSNGFKGYEVEKGDYKFTISTDSHNAKDMENAVVSATVAADIKYENDPTTGTKVENLYTDVGSNSSDYQLFNGTLSRADFEGTWPAPRTLAEKQIGGSYEQLSATWAATLSDYSGNPNNPNASSYTAMPTTSKQTMVTDSDGKQTAMQIKDLVGVDYDDEKWETFMDQLTLDQMTTLVNQGGFQTAAITEYGIPQTNCTDGPVGWVNFMNSKYNNNCGYCCEAVLAATWNVDRLYDMGVSVGDEALVGDDSGIPYTGWYAPGLNIHRSPFGGRNFEYYSEDPMLAGMMTSAIVKGCRSKGVFCTIKHFALNEQETHRSSNGVLTWATEQSMREIYLKGFEYAVKGGNSDLKAKYGELGTLALMSSFNRIGDRWAGGDYRLLTQILRNEWGFQGMVICDFNTCNHMVERDMVYAGGDLNLQIANMMMWKPGPTSAADVTVTRMAAKNILYVVANTNGVRGDFTMALPIWQIVMYVVSAVIAAILAVWGIFAIRGAKKAPEVPAKNKKK